MASRHNISRADALFSGRAHLPGYKGNIPGIELQPLVRWRPVGLRAITFASAPAAGATNAPLSANWAGPTVAAPITLSSGQVVNGIFTNGQTALPFLGSFPETGAPQPAALTSPATTAAVVGNMPPVAANATALAASQSVAASTPTAPVSMLFNGVAPYATTLNGVSVAQPDVPRNIVAAWTGAAVITVTGYDSAGQLMTESAASGTSFTGNKAFAYVSSVTFSAAVTAATLGFGAKLGFPFKVIPGDLFAMQLGGVADAGTIVPPDFTLPATSFTGDPKGTYTPAGSLDGVKYLAALLNVADRTSQFGTWGVPQA